MARNSVPRPAAQREFWTAWILRSLIKLGFNSSANHFFRRTDSWNLPNARPIGWAGMMSYYARLSTSITTSIARHNTGLFLDLSSQSNWRVLRNFSSFPKLLKYSSSKYSGTSTVGDLIGEWKRAIDKLATIVLNSYLQQRKCKLFQSASGLFAEKYCWQQFPSSSSPPLAFSRIHSQA